MTDEAKQRIKADVLDRVERYNATLSQFSTGRARLAFWAVFSLLCLSAEGVHALLLCGGLLAGVIYFAPRDARQIYNDPGVTGFMRAWHTDQPLSVTPLQGEWPGWSAVVEKTVAQWDEVPRVSVRTRGRSLEADCHTSLCVKTVEMLMDAQRQAK